MIVLLSAVTAFLYQMFKCPAFVLPAEDEDAECRDYEVYVRLMSQAASGNHNDNDDDDNDIKKKVYLESA